MSTNARRYFSGSTLEAAVMQAAGHHGIEPGELAYRRVEKRHGFLKARRAVVIEVDPEAPRREPEAAAADETAVAPTPRAAVSSPADAEDGREGETAEGGWADDAPEDQEEVDFDEAPPRSSRRAAAADLPLADGEAAEAVRQGLERILALAALDLEITIRQGDEQLEIDLAGADEDLLVADRGRLLMAIQHLLPRVVRGAAGTTVRCRVDAGNFQQDHQERLRALAERSARQVRRQQRPWTFEPMAPEERRIIHLALADDPAVVTESEGRGFFKRLTIRPAQNRPRGFDRYGR